MLFRQKRLRKGSGQLLNHQEKAGSSNSWALSHMHIQLTIHVARDPGMLFKLSCVIYASG